MKGRQATRTFGEEWRGSLYFWRGSLKINRRQTFKRNVGEACTFGGKKKKRCHAAWDEETSFEQ